jgi:hypothetical protein
MPNWVFNSLAIEAVKADPEQITKLISQLNTSFVRNSKIWDLETNQMLFKDFAYTNPVFAFWNIIKPTDMETYKHNWYDWEVCNWGTDYDVAVRDENEDPSTNMERHDNGVIYNFNTADSPPTPAILALSSQYPELVFHLFYEEEAGWGGDIKIMKGVVLSEQSYDNQCPGCDTTDCLTYDDKGVGVCSECDYGH